MEEENKSSYLCGWGQAKDNSALEFSCLLKGENHYASHKGEAWMV
jgi:hypothetical protein